MMNTGSPGRMRLLSPKLTVGTALPAFTLSNARSLSWYGLEANEPWQYCNPGFSVATRHRAYGIDKRSLRN